MSVCYVAIDVQVSDVSGNHAKKPNLHCCQEIRCGNRSHMYSWQYELFGLGNVHMIFSAQATVVEATGPFSIAEEQELITLTPTQVWQ